MSFDFEVETDPNKVDYDQVTAVLQGAGLSKSGNSQEHEKAFKNSDITIFVKGGSQVVGVGRALTDFVSQGAIYNVAVDPDYQGRGVGNAIVTGLLDRLKGINVILYTHPQTLKLYEKYGFRRNKTAFAHFEHGSPEGKQWMEDEGFFLPEGYRFESEIGRY